MADFDVVIVGAGPAGCATALSLSDFAPALRVCLIDAPSRADVHIGETVPPQVRPLLEHLGIWQSFVADSHYTSYRTVSAWGSPYLRSNEFLFDTHQVGWRLDRARFDAMMRHAASARVAVSVTAKVGDAVLTDGGWRLVADGTSVTARFAVDATGRTAALARRQGVRPVIHDRLVGCFVLFDGAADDGEGLMIETFADGWWYSAAIPGGRRVIACMSDADMVRERGLARIERWMQALGATEHVRATAAGARPAGPPTLRPAGSQRITHPGALPVLCVGDGASCFDPVSGQGIVKALRSGIFASYAIGDFLGRGDARGLARYRGFVEAEFASYLATLRDYYALERRWADHPFWQRRRDAKAAEEPRAPQSHAQVRAL